MLPRYFDPVTLISDNETNIFWGDLIHVAAKKKTLNLCRWKY